MYSLLKYLDPVAAGTALDLEAGESPDASSFCQFLPSELLWIFAPAPTANALHFLQLVEQKGIVFTLSCWACFGRHNEKEKNVSCMLKKYGI